MAAWPAWIGHIKSKLCKSLRPVDVRVSAPITTPPSNSHTKIVLVEARHCGIAGRKSLKTTPSLVWYRRYDFTVSVHKHHLKQKPSMMPPHSMNLSAHIYLWSNLSILICCWSSFQWTPPVLVSWRHRLGMGLSIVDDTATWRKLDSHLICLSFYIHDHSWYDETPHFLGRQTVLFSCNRMFTIYELPNQLTPEKTAFDSWRKLTAFR